MTQTYRMEDLLSLMEKLRDPKLGCNWDKKQTLKSLTAYTLEEVYEVIDAVESGDDRQLQDELGDLLFQVVFYTQIAKEEGRFDFTAVISAITDKLLRRHPHVFPDATLASFGTPALQGIHADEVAARWELIKNAERARKASTQEHVRQLSVLDDIPNSLPALERARKLQKRAASLGFDWTQVADVIAKLREEIVELEQEIARGDTARIEDELGDLLFSCVNLGRHLHADPETALRRSNRKFEARFRAMEHSAAQQSRQLQELDAQALNSLWEKIKAQE